MKKIISQDTLIGSKLTYFKTMKQCINCYTLNDLQGPKCIKCNYAFYEEIPLAEKLRIDETFVDHCVE